MTQIFRGHPDGEVLDETDIQSAVHDIEMDAAEDDEPIIDMSPGVCRLKRVSSEDEEDQMFMVSSKSMDILTGLVPYKVCGTCHEYISIKKEIKGCGLTLKWVWDFQIYLPDKYFLYIFLPYLNI